MPTHRRQRDPNPPRGVLLALGLAISLAACAGCSSLPRRAATAKELANCRQLTQQGTSAMERGDWKRAETLLGRAVQTCSSDADARRQYAEALRHRGALDEALAELEQARRFASEDPMLAVRTGETYLALDRPADARRSVDEALQIDPKFAPAWALRGRVASAAGQTREALADFQRALGYAPDNTDAAIQVAEAYRQLNEPERALVTLQSVSNRYTRGEEPQQVMYLEGLALSSLGRYPAAAHRLNQAAHRDRPSAEILYRLAEAEMLAGHLPDAQVRLQEALALEPSHAGSLDLKARMSAVARNPPRQ